MRILVCARHVADSTEIRWDEARGEIVLRGLPTKISDYDRNALEAAVVLKESGEHVDLDVVMIGGEPALKTLKEAVAMGADKGYHRKDFVKSCRERNIAPHVAASHTPVTGIVP